MQRTNIEWADFTANPIKYRDAAGMTVWACVKVSKGCEKCYAEAIAQRYNRGGPFTASTMRTLTPFLDEKELHRMLTYKPALGKRVFVADMTDLFGPWVPDEILDRLFAIFALRSDVTFQVLTKRPERMREYLTKRSRSAQPWKDAASSLGWSLEFEGISLVPSPPPNVWAGVSVENQDATWRVVELLQTPAAVRFLSVEPMLSAVDPTRIKVPRNYGTYLLDALTGKGVTHHGEPFRELPPVSWIICGGESGPGARPMDEAWVRSLRDQCVAAGVSFFFKQKLESGRKVSLPMLDGRQWAQFPEDR